MAPAPDRARRSAARLTAFWGLARRAPPRLAGRWVLAVGLVLLTSASEPAAAQIQALTDAQRAQILERLDRALSGERDRVGVVIGDGRSRLELGETTRLSVASRIPGDLTLFDFAPDGTVALVYPNPLADAPIAPGAPLVLDGLSVAPPLGRSRLVALVAPPAFSWTGPAAAALAPARGFAPLPDPAALFDDILGQIEASRAALPDAPWGLSLVSVDIGPAAPGPGLGLGGAGGGGGGRDLETDAPACPLAAADGLLPFPDPAPAPTSQIQITHLELRDALARLGAPTGTETPTLMGAFSALQAALRRRGYTEQRVYRSARGCGLAVATRLEQIDGLGAPKAEPERFSVAAGDAFSIGEALLALFFVPDPGRWRVAVFSLSTHAVRTTRPEADAGPWARDLLARSALVAPDAAQAVPLDGRFKLQVLVYEFARERLLKTPDPSAADDLLRQLTQDESGLSVGQHLRASALGALVGAP